LNFQVVKTVTSARQVSEDKQVMHIPMKEAASVGEQAAAAVAGRQAVQERKERVVGGEKGKKMMEVGVREAPVLVTPPPSLANDLFDFPETEV
jgi:predicted AAA+ superfamily ATPase